ncbi:ABC transporter substrate-binding protein, partial [Thermodesulfobacteriota bacterium]
MKKFSIVLMVALLICLFLSHVVQPAIAADKHKYGGKLVITSKGAAYNFGVPTNQGGGGQHHFARMSLEQLVKADPKKPSSHIPWLAESWKLAPDRSYYDFHLKKGVKFHDGTDFNAQAVKFNHDMVVASKLPFLREIKSIEVIDNYTVRYNLSAWHSLVFTDFERPEQFILSPAAYEKQGEKELNNNPVGTGPWIVDRFKRNSFVFYKKNPNYWEKGLPYLDTIQILFIPDLMTQ